MFQNNQTEKRTYHFLYKIVFKKNTKKKFGTEKTKLKKMPESENAPTATHEEGKGKQNFAVKQFIKYVCLSGRDQRLKQSNDGWRSFDH